MLVMRASGGWTCSSLKPRHDDKVFRVNHSKNQFALKGEAGATVTVNGIESFWSFTKRRLNKFNGYSVNFDLHLKECEWCWSKTKQELIDQLPKILKTYNEYNYTFLA